MKTLHSYDKVEECIRNKEVFQTRLRQFLDGGRGRHLTGEWVRPNVYVVYHYGPHYPMFLYDKDTDKWFENTTKYSRTTSKHVNRFRPCTMDFHMCLDDMHAIIYHGGYIQWVAKKLTAIYANA